MSDQGEQRLRTLLRETSDEVLTVDLAPRAHAAAVRRRRVRSVSAVAASAVAISATGLTVWALRASTPDEPAPSIASNAIHKPAGSIASGTNGPLTLEVLAVDRTAGTATGNSACVTVTFELRNTGKSATPVTGSDLLSIDLLDEGGPVTEAEGSTVRHLASTDFWSCTSPSAPQGFPPAHARPSTPPGAQLAPGQTYGPFTLAFTVGGPTSQSLSLVWDGPAIALP